MKNCTIHFLQAMAGDCFVLEFENKECIVIDCGYKSTYKNELRPLLLKLKNKGCKVTLLLITHTDRDHIEGAIEFIKDNGSAFAPNIITVENIWYNGIYNTLCFNPEMKKRVNSCSSEQQCDIDYYLANMLAKLPDITGDISANNCMDFEQLCVQNRYSINSCFQGSIAMRDYSTRDEKKNSSIQIGKCKITILSPSKKEIVNLSKALHYDMLRTLGSNYIIDSNSKFVKLCELILEMKSDTFNYEETISSNSEDIESWLETSNLAEMNEVNKASIVVEIEYGNLKMLFTGDSESSLWCKLLDEKYDVIKISHHGTTKPNIEMLKCTKGKIALISTNGYKNNRHPEKETLARLVLSGYRNLYFNYTHPFKDILIDNQERYGYKAFFEQDIIEL